MAVSAMETRIALTLGPLQFHWPIEKLRDFYARIADEAPVEVVYLGEVVCSKRAPFSEPHYASIAERLTRAGKQVVFSSLAEVMLRRERRMTEALCELTEFEIEINDASALSIVNGRSHRIGQMFNVYNEEALRHLARGGATHFSLPVELPRQSVEILAGAARALSAQVEVFAFGRVPLAISARCYHARVHGRTKDSCQFVCDQDPDGMVVKTLDGQDFLAVNGVQTLSYTHLCLLHEIEQLRRIGVKQLRLSPHTLDMIGVASLFRAVVDRAIAPAEAERRLLTLDQSLVLANGFWHGRAGHALYREAHA
jgi:collagenase-like PrtC family protease